MMAHLEKTEQSRTSGLVRTRGPTEVQRGPFRTTGARFSNDQGQARSEREVERVPKMIRD